MTMALAGGKSGGMIDCKLLLGGTLLPSFKAHTFLTFVRRLALVVVAIVAATAIEDVVVVCDMLWEYKAVSNQPASQRFVPFTLQVSLPLGCQIGMGCVKTRVGILSVGDSVVVAAVDWDDDDDDDDG